MALTVFIQKMVDKFGKLIKRSLWQN